MTQFSRVLFIFLSPKNKEKKKLSQRNFPLLFPRGCLSALTFDVFLLFLLTFSDGKAKH